MIMMLVFLPFLLMFLIKNCPFKASNLPPSPHIWEVLSNFTLFIKRPHVAFSNLAKIYGPLFSLRLGTQVVVVASSPAVAKEILRNKNFTGRYMPFLHHNIPGTKNASLMMSQECNDAWKSLRGIGQSYVYSSKAIDSNVKSRNASIVKMVNVLRTKEGQVVNIDNIVFATFTNIISNVLVSRNLIDCNVDLEDKNVNRVMAIETETIETSTKLGLADIFPILKWIDFWTKRKALYLYGNTMLVWGKIIKERRAKDVINPESSRKDLLGALVESGFSDDQIATSLMEILIASTDSTMATLVWLMIELIKTQEILRKVREEIGTHALQRNTLDESLLCECQYFNACIKETLRLHVAAPIGIPRRAIETCIVNNYTIPKNSMVLVNFWSIHLDSRNWEDPREFKPERFFNSKIDFKGNNFELTPFSAGQRMCPGYNVAINGIQFIAGALVHYFDWILPDGVCASDLGMADKFGTSLKSDKPLCLIPKIRENI